jgi:molybdopterin synthase sulfur carrier subunit
MPIKVRAQEPLRRLLENQPVVEVDSRTVLEAIEELQRHYPGVRDRVLHENGALRGFVNIYVNEENIRFLQEERTQLKDGDEVSIVPSNAGG